jgi:hypothetical protein
MLRIYDLIKISFRNTTVLDRSASVAVEGLYDPRSGGPFRFSRSYHQCLLCRHRVDYMVQEQVADTSGSHPHPSQ